MKMHCPFCEFSTESSPVLLQHYVKNHRKEPEFSVECSFCSITYKNPASLRSHYYRHHYGSAVDVDSSSPMQSGSPALDGRNEELGHEATGVHPLQRVGSSFEGDDGESGNPSQPRSQYFSQSSGTTVEENREEAEAAELMSDDGSDNDNIEMSMDNVAYFNLSMEQQDADNDVPSDNESLGSNASDAGPGPDLANNLQWDSAKFLLHLKEEAMISQAALNKAVDGVEELFSKFSKSIKDRILEGMDASGSVPEDHIKKTFEEFSGGLFSGIDSKAALESFCQEHLSVFDLKKVELYESEEWLNGRIHTIKHCAYMSPFLPGFKRLLSRPDVFACIENPTESEEGVYKSYRDGKFCKSHPILSKEGSVGVISAYDDLEVSSPLGPKKHKLALYYWTLANFSPQMRSSLRSVQLMAIAWSKDLRDSGKRLSASPSLDLKYERHCKIFAPFLNDIKILEKGVDIIVNNEKKKICGSLLCVCGDCPAVNVLGGFKESVGPAHKPCHKCHVDHEEMKCIFNEDVFEKRTPANLKMQLEEVLTSPTLKIRQEKSTLYGINGPAVISGLDHFCPVQCFCYDLMHVIHEGVLEAHLRLLIKYYIDNGKVTIDEINSQVQIMSYQLFSKDRPAPILPGHQNSGLRQSAAQMLCLAICVPFVLLKKSDTLELKERLLNFSRLLQITMGLLAYELTTQDLSKLRRLIWTHHDQFVRHYPEFDVIPKFHYLIHLPTQIEYFGPSRITWSMRFESMHSYFKNLIRISKNFINVPLSCTKRYEGLRASQMLVKPGHQPQDFIEKKDVLQFNKEVKVQEYRHKNLLCQLFSTDERIKLYKTLKTKGTVFSINSIVLLDDAPTFGAVVDILCHDELKILIVSVLKTLRYEALCNAYYLSLETPEVKLCLLENLSHFQPLNCMSVCADIKHLWVIPKYHKISFNHPH